jgi:hypothetical protein
MKPKRGFFGQSLIEFALVFPIFFFLILGLLDLGRAVFYYSSLSNAVRMASREGVVMQYSGVTEADLEDVVIEYGFGLANFTNIDVEIIDIISPTSFFIEKVQVVASYCFNPITPGIASLFGTTCPDGSTGIELEAVSVMRVEPGTR